jgi:hypothetical protein
MGEDEALSGRGRPWGGASGWIRRGGCPGRARPGGHRRMGKRRPSARWIDVPRSLERKSTEKRQHRDRAVTAGRRLGGLGVGVGDWREEEDDTLNSDRPI